MNFNSKYIASGSYGCVINPAYNCDTKLPMENTVSKLFSDKKEWKYEIEQNKKISELDKTNKFTVKMINNCEISSTYIKKNVKNIDECSIIEDENKIYQIIYENGGYDLRDLFIYNNIKRYYNDFDIKNFLIKMILIFEGLYKIELSGISHRDIKLDNLLYNGNKISLIDFGLMINKNKMFDTDNLKIYSNIRNTVYYYPIELKLYAIKKLKESFENLDLNTDVLVKMLKSYINENKNNSSNELYLIEINKILDNITINSLNYLEYFKNLKTEIDLNQFEKVDVYLLGIVLLELIIYIAIYIPKYIIKMDFFKLISKMIEIDPYKRINMLEALNSYRQIVNN